MEQLCIDRFGNLRHFKSYSNDETVVLVVLKEVYSVSHKRYIWEELWAMEIVNNIISTFS